MSGNTRLLHFWYTIPCQTMAPKKKAMKTMKAMKAMKAMKTMKKGKFVMKALKAIKAKKKAAKEEKIAKMKAAGYGFDGVCPVTEVHGWDPLVGTPGIHWIHWRLHE